LNLVYVVGIMSVFAIFAVVAAVSTFGWGEQFTYFPVKLGLTLLMFALALSYLGVWEIPVPGMAAGSASQELQSREGLVGAFSKGAFATILATPCSGPLLGYILGLTLGLSPFHTIAIFMFVGLGMSLPYLIIGIEPKLVAWLPKPGAWMETLKQLMAFLFLGTVAFFFAQFNEEQKVPVFVSLIGVWFGCWIIGQVPNWAALEKRMIAWGAGIAAATLIGVWSFSYLKPDHKLAWEDYTEPRLQQLQSEGRTVMVDFGAKWCGTCIYNYEVAINTVQTREVVDELGAVTLYADWTDHNQEIKQKLAELNSRSIPLLAIYPAGRPHEPIILRDLVTQQNVIDALRQAGASRASASLSRPTSSIASTHR
jgi:thiol:disulfide interchange protein